MIIPFQHLRPATLQSLIEDYVTRQGAIHGHRDISLEDMVRQVLRQLHAGEVVVVYNQADETCSICPAPIAAKMAAADPPDAHPPVADDVSESPPPMAEFPD